MVTGAAGGIGGAIARAYAREGARLLLADRDGARLQAVADECASYGADVESVEADLGEVAGADRTIETCSASRTRSR